MKVLKCIGIGGQKQNGKDTLADYLSPKLVRKVPTPCHGGGTFRDEPWGRGSFASAVKKIFCDTFGKDLAFIEEWKTKDECPPGMTLPVRQALTFIGDGFRKIQPNIWIETAFRPENDPYGKVFSDVRYINEAHKIKQEGGMNVLVYRENGLNWDESGSEAEIRPYVQWCIATGREGRIADWIEYRQKDMLEVFKDRATAAEFQASIPSHWYNTSVGEANVFFANLAQFDLFIRSPDGVENVYAKADAIVIPYIRDNFTNVGE